MLVPWLLAISSVLLGMTSAAQLPLASSPMGWRVELSTDWDVLGPFPIHAREQHFLSPSFPINLSEPIDYNKTWMSAYADGGYVTWSTALSNANGDLKVSFPNIRWASLRATEGWAALQHHAVLRSTLTVYPPENQMSDVGNPPRLLVDLVQGAFFTILPSSVEDRVGLTPEWFTGNIYAMERPMPQNVRLPTAPSVTAPTKYDIFINGDYEIRLFGDPRGYGSDVPIQSISISVGIEIPTEKAVWEPSHDVTCDFLEGYAFGNALGIGLRSISGWWTVTDAKLREQSDAIEISHLKKMRLAPTQTRVIPLEISQSKPFTGTELHVDLIVTCGDSSTVVSATIPIKQHSMWTVSRYSVIKASYFFAESNPTPFLVIPPAQPNDGEPRPPILALHGAGVDIIEMPFWSEALPRQSHSWVIMPTGRTSWGMDWHGPSTQDVWQSLAALTTILDRRHEWHPWRLKQDTKVLVLGHSNGGQGAWYLASRYPDRVVAVAPAAGYIKSQAYVPLTQSRSGHFIDPALRSILESSLTPDDNDLFLSNLAEIPLLAIHGGDDDNVPVWHSRAALDVVKTWNPAGNASYQEDPGQPHWYPSAFTSSVVLHFLENNLQRPAIHTPSEFTLTVSIPAESHSLHGWRIESIRTPGRLARLAIRSKGGDILVQTTNVRSFSIDQGIYLISTININVDGNRVLFGTQSEGKKIVRFVLDNNRTWMLDRSNDASLRLQASGRFSAIFTSNASLVLVVPSSTLESRALSVALRVAHDLALFHKLDVDILSDSEIMEKVRGDALGGGNVIVIGQPGTAFMAHCLKNHASFELDGRTLRLQGHSLNEGDLGQYLNANAEDSVGLERAARAFPIRTGITVPDWILLGKDADRLGAGGVLGAGLWDEWGWTEVASWLDINSINDS
ncbi:hypothetical protein JAAARDRAFT_76873 [Jaapia argillacea MUCL 33604]|uniref:Peptidase S9 prolyl oligopeptidase catalytic domain-containing protein n=1 Tax=Jaapia argillacea MUCL 33604 TaxID=933084 RepID=A0A067Q0H4_9AGAM|nr:hypothetical protein JAAARDRAFT_76873 [Jaapia argillacea MUCL 33604]